METSEIETITLYCFEKSQQNSKEHQITSLIDFPNAKYAKFKGYADVFHGGYLTASRIPPGLEWSVQASALARRKGSSMVSF